MPKKRHKAEEIVAKLRQVDVLVSQGQNVADANRRTHLLIPPPSPSYSAGNRFELTGVAQGIELA
jgi:hypothetical protein